MIAMADEIQKDSDSIRESRGFVGTPDPSLKPLIKAAYVAFAHGLLLFVLGDDAYFCGSGGCWLTAFTFKNEKWIKGPDIDLLWDPNDIYLYNAGGEYPDISSDAIIREGTVVARFDPTSGKYEECGFVTSVPPPLVSSGSAVQHPAISGSSQQPSQDLTSYIPLEEQGGALVVPVLINDTITLKFVVDSGAADVSIPADVVLTLMRTGTIDPSDFLGSRTYVLANGSTVPSAVLRIRSLKVGTIELDNVTASVADVSGTLLLGQSFLRRFKSWSIDNQRPALVLIRQ